MSVLAVGIVLILAAVACGWFAIAGVPAGRVDRSRVDAYAVVERRPLMRRAVDDTVAHVDQVLSRRGWRPFRAEELELAGIRSSVASLFVGVTAIAAATFALLALVSGRWVLSFLIAALVPVLAKVVVRIKIARRRKRFAGQLAPLLAMLASSLRAGHSLPKAMDAAARDADSPMAEELAKVVTEYRIGRDLVPAMERVAERMDSLDFRWIAQAIDAQRETGGNLNEILDQVAETIRERQHVRMQVMALSAEGRLSAAILMALPVGIGVYYSFVAADRMGIFVGSGIGKLIILISALLYVAGGFWMRSIVRIEF